MCLIPCFVLVIFYMEYGIFVKLHNIREYQLSSLQKPIEQIFIDSREVNYVPIGEKYLLV